MQHTQALLLIIIVLISGSCCKKVACNNYNEVHLFFTGYDSTDLDTIYVQAFETGSDYKKTAGEKMIDNALYHSTYTNSNFSYTLAVDKDWELVIPATGQEIRVRYYQFETIRCTSGCGPLKDKYSALSGFNLNGRQIKDHMAGISKP